MPFRPIRTIGRLILGPRRDPVAPTPADPVPLPDSKAVPGLIPLLILAWRNRRLLKMTLSSITAYVSAAGLVCGAIYTAVNLHDPHTAFTMLMGALAAFGINRQASITRDVVDPTRPTPTPTAPVTPEK